MEKRKTVFTYISQVFATFGIIVTIFILFSFLIGEGTGEYSTLFRLGKAGLGLSALLELLLLAAVITLVRVMFLTDWWIKNMTIVWRNVLFFLSVLAAIVVMILLFDWFPVDDAAAWGGFLISFILGMGLSILISRLREQAENSRMQAALDKYMTNSAGEAGTP